MSPRSGTQSSLPEAPGATPELGPWPGVLFGMLGTALVALVLVVCAVTLVPRFFGGIGLPVLHSSMEPTYVPGDLVVTVPQEDYAIGAVVTFQPRSDSPVLVTHRVVAHRTGPTDVRYVTRGDANTHDDAPIKASQILGEVLYHVPYLGHVAQAAARHRILLSMIAGLGLLAYAGYAFSTGFPRERPRKKDETP